eukprot:TRINITY_DN7136_c0_g4_i1.p1 TRINITY_DN7136_c0_g4~~TRINITY_DN7136_c0_g4_i1.p1  ORF type:complete len:388 (-),score=90.29 TRINITY_DN7136_c0_g4_i1:222-1385(-)
MMRIFFFFQAEDGIRDHAQSRGLGDVYKRQTQSTWGGTWADKLKDGFYEYERGNLKVAVLLYLEAAFLGNDVAFLNAAILLDRYHIFNDEDLDYSRLQEILNDDPIYESLLQNHIVSKQSSIFDTTYDDIVQLLPENAQTDSELRRLFMYNHTEEHSKNNASKSMEYNKAMSFRLYKVVSEETQDSLAFLRLGDFHYYGIHAEVDYEKAALYYTGAVATLGNDSYVAQAYFNIAYMVHFGIYFAKNYSEAYNFYNKSLTLTPESYLTIKPLMWLARLEMERAGVLLGVKEWLFSHLDTQAARGYVGISLITALCLLWGLRLRNQNYIEIYGPDEDEDDEHEHHEREPKLHKDQAALSSKSDCWSIIFELRLVFLYIVQSVQVQVMRC